MRVHLRELLKDGAEPAWLLERGERGRAYRIEAEGGIAWWQAKREAMDLSSAERRDRLQQMRLDLVGDTTEAEKDLALSGRQRREEYEAAMTAIKYRRTLGELLERDAVERVLSSAAVALRRKLQQLAPEFGIAAGLPADQVRELATRIERAVASF